MNSFFYFFDFKGIKFGNWKIWKTKKILKNIRYGRFYNFLKIVKTSRLQNYKTPSRKFRDELTTQFYNIYKIYFYKKHSCIIYNNILYVRLHNFLMIIKICFIKLFKRENINTIMQYWKYGLWQIITNITNIRYQDGDPYSFFILLVIR